MRDDAHAAIEPETYTPLNHNMTRKAFLCTTIGYMTASQLHKTDAIHCEVKQAASDEQVLLLLCKSLEAPGRPLNALKLSSVKTHSCYRLLEFAPAHTGPRRVRRDVL